MIKELVFHIGDPKNGSSSIQRALQSRAWTCDSVTIAPQKELNASELANSINANRGHNPKKRTRAFTKKADWAAQTDADLGIISAEFFSAVRPRALVKALKEFLPDHVHSARVVAYVRPHASRVVSSYAQRVKTGTFTGDFGAFVNHPSMRRKFIYYPRFARWQRVFGDRFTLRPFIREELLDQDVTADFFNVALRGAAFTLKPAAAANESLTLEELSGMRVVQAVLVARKVPDFLRLSIGGAIGRELAGMSGRSRNKQRLDRESASHIAASYRDDAMRMDAQFFEGAPMERALTEAVDTAEPSPMPIPTEAYFQPGEIAELQRLARELAALVKDKPQAWRHDYQLGIGQIRPGDKVPMSKAKKQNAAQTWTTLREIARILVSGHAA